MNTKEKLHNSIDVKNLTYHYKDLTAHVNFNNFIDAVIIFDEIRFIRIKLVDAEKIEMELKFKLSNIKTGNRKSIKQNSEIKSITSVCNVQEDLIKFFKYYSTVMHNAAIFRKIFETNSSFHMKKRTKAKV